MSDPYSILVLANDAHVRRTVVPILKAASCAVTTAPATGPTSRELVRQNFDLIIVDQPAPGREDPPVVPKLRRAHPHTPILVLAHQAYPELAEELRQKGATGYMLSPVDANCLVGQVHTLLLERLLLGVQSNVPHLGKIP